MIFDDICRNLEFELGEVKGDKNYIINNFHLGQLLKRRK